MSSTIFCDAVDLTDMVRIPAGEFLLGTLLDELDEAEGSCFPPTSVCLEEFWIDRVPVTYRQYKIFVDDTGHIPPIRDRQRAGEAQFLPYLWNQDRSYPAGLDDKPVIFVTWYDAMAYCEWAGKCLPTEFEWEKAARGTDGRRFPWGNDANATRYCNCPPDFTPKHVVSLTDVDDFPQGASPYGCLDMLGNAQEWCWNSYHLSNPLVNAQEEALSLRLPPVFVHFPPCPIGRSAGRAVKGEARLAPPFHVALRLISDPWKSSPYIGFRCIWYPVKPIHTWY
jgi:formylglycine-generating enzyme required for sulfatase activity